MENNPYILFACDANKSRPWFRDRIPGILSAIESFNRAVELVDIYSFLGDYELDPSDVNQRYDFFATADFLKINKKFYENVISYNPEWLILGTADNYRDFLLPSTVAKIRASGVKVAGILGDDEFNYQSYKFYLGWFDIHMVYVNECLKYYSQFEMSRGYYLPNSCHLKNAPFESLTQDVTYDVILIGAPIANRPSMIRRLIDGGVNVGIYGSQSWHNYDFAAQSYKGFVDTEDFDAVLSSGKIVLAFLEDHLTGKLHMNTKIWEAVRVGRLPIATYYKPLIEDYGLTPGVNILMYRDEEDLLQKVLEYAGDDSLRIGLASNLYNFVLRKLDYSKLYHDFFNFLSGHSCTEFVQNKAYTKSLEVCGIAKSVSDINRMDLQIENHIRIFKKSEHSERIISFNKISNGFRIVQYWPFVSFSSMIYVGNGGRVDKFVSFIKNDIYHINQFCIVSQEVSFSDRINKYIDAYIDKNRHKISILIKKLRRFINGNKT